MCLQCLSTYCSVSVSGVSSSLDKSFDLVNASSCEFIIYEIGDEFTVIKLLSKRDEEPAFVIDALAEDISWLLVTLEMPLDLTLMLISFENFVSIRSVHC